MIHSRWENNLSEAGSFVLFVWNMDVQRRATSSNKPVLSLITSKGTKTLNWVVHGKKGRQRNIKLSCKEKRNRWKRWRPDSNQHKLDTIKIEKMVKKSFVTGKTSGKRKGMFCSFTPFNHKINKEYYWSMLDKNGENASDRIAETSQQMLPIPYKERNRM